MAEERSLEECVRQCVREELRRSSSAQGHQSDLVQRTRQLISSSATALSRDLGRQTSSLSSRPNSGSNIQQTMSTPGSKRTNVNVPGHNFRIKKRGKTAVKTQVIPKSVYLLEETEQPQDQDYTVVDDMIVLKGQFDLSSDFTEDDIRAELASLFSTKLPHINQRDFDFVKRERNTISLPVVKDDHKWDFKHIKHLCGNGRLYVRLNVPKHTLVSLSDDEEMVHDAHDADNVQPSELRAAGPGMSASEPQPGTSVGGLHSGTSAGEPQPGTSMSGSTDVEESAFIQDGLRSLLTIFPNTRTEILRESLIVHQDIEAAANSLSESGSSLGHGGLVRRDDEDASKILQRLKKTMKPYVFAEKVKLDKEDLLMDLFSIYKSPDFDPCLQIKLQIRGEPAIDTGGVLRQSFSDVFGQIAEGEGYLRLFRGQHARLTPIYSSEHVLTGIFEVLGKMIAHSLVQGGPGFPYLAPGIFWYIATGDLSQAVGRSSFIDVGDMELAAFLERVREVQYYILRCMICICQP